MAPPQTPFDDADREMASTESLLERDHPDVAPDLIHVMVQQSYTTMTPAKVHSYLSILVVRDVQARLGGRAA